MSSDQVFVGQAHKRTSAIDLADLGFPPSFQFSGHVPGSLTTKEFEDDEQRNRRAACLRAPCLKTRKRTNRAPTSPKRKAPSCTTCAVDVGEAEVDERNLGLEPHTMGIRHLTRPRRSESDAGV